MNTPAQGNDRDKRRVAKEIQKPYMEEFSAQLERVGFRVWRPFWERLEQEEFRELRAFWARIWPLLVDEGRRSLFGYELAELETIMAKLTTHDRAKAEQIREEVELATWTVVMSVMDIGGTAVLVGGINGGRILAWSWSMYKRPTVLDGALRLDVFKPPADRNPRRRITGLNGHLLTLESDFAVVAAKDADYAARTFIPHARQLCNDMNATLLEEEAKLERVRDQLTEEIIRVRERRAAQEKRLKLEVEH